jgi:hypothetical protein
VLIQRHSSSVEAPKDSFPALASYELAAINDEPDQSDRASLAPCQIFPPNTQTTTQYLPLTMSSSEEARALVRSEFWDERYAKADGDKPTHEWFRAFDALEPFFEKHLFQARGAAGKSQKVLHLGSGDSVRDSSYNCYYLSSIRARLINCQTIPYDLLERGYTNQLCVDFSTVVVEAMKSRHADKPQVEWQVGDVRDMKALGTKSVDVAFDKGTLDAMIHGSPWSPPDEVLENSGKYINEVSLGVRHMWCLKLMMMRS